MKLRKSKKSNEVNYWMSFSDGAIGMLFLLILIVLMLLLSSFLTESDNLEGEADNEGVSSPYIQSNYENNSISGSSDQEEIDEEYDTILAAVKVVIIDGTNKSVIKQKGVTFRLLDKKGVVTLTNYYPTQSSYVEFQTNDEGYFYLPQKIPAGSYSFENTTAPKGYSLTSNTSFTISESADWGDPYTVYISFGDLHSFLEIHQVDADSDTAVSGGTYNIYADDIIYDSQNQIIYSSGDLVSTVTCDSSGVALSVSLQQGDYRVIQTERAPGYSINTQIYRFTVNSQNLNDDNVVSLEIPVEKIKLYLLVCDELSEKALEGAEFALADSNGNVLNTFTSDINGKVEVYGIEDGETYQIRQTKWCTNYLNKSYETTVVVDKNGLINGKESENITVTNRKTVLEVTCVDKMFGFSPVGEKLTIINESGKTVYSWTVNDSTSQIEGLEPGNYRIRSSGKLAFLTADKEITVNDQKEVQKITYSLLSLKSLLASICALGLVVVGGLIAIIFIRKRKKHKSVSEDG